ncbi:endonuclease domain-containing protein [Agrobacterium tumefaciens]|nr:endonuclease domain-containing protein [Agrobacterium tumefaciens]
MSIHNAKHLKEKRKELRNNLTPAEATLWKYLQHSKLDGRKFRRQHSVKNYILDFYCPSEKLGIELDGESHYSYAAEEYDRERTENLNKLGITIIRFENEDVFHEENILEAIRKHFKTNH